MSARAIKWKYASANLDVPYLGLFRTNSTPIYCNYLIFKFNDTLILNKRTQQDIWKNLYDFPLVETERLLSEENFLESKEWRKIIGRHSCTIAAVSKIHKHVLSHQKIYARFWEITLPKPLGHTFENAITIKQSDFINYPIPRLLENYIERNQKLRTGSWGV